MSLSCINVSRTAHRSKHLSRRYEDRSSTENHRTHPRIDQENLQMEEVGAALSSVIEDGAYSGDRRNVRVSAFQCTLNCNIAHGSAETSHEHLTQLADWLDNDLFQQSTLESLIPIDGGADNIYEVKIVNAGVEIGPRLRRIHAHWQLIIVHSSRVRLGEIQKLWQDYARAHAPMCQGGYLNMRLLDTRPQNYSSKNPQF